MIFPSYFYLLLFLGIQFSRCRHVFHVLDFHKDCECMATNKNNIFPLMYFRNFSISHLNAGATRLYLECVPWYTSSGKVHGKCQVKATQSESYRPRRVE